MVRYNSDDDFLYIGNVKWKVAGLVIKYIFDGDNSLGAIVPFVASKSGTNTVTISKTDLYTMCDASLGRNAMLCTSEKIDVTNYNYLVIDTMFTLTKDSSGMGTGYMLFVLASDTNFSTSNVYELKRLTSTSARADYKIDISGLEGEYYLKIYTSVTSTYYGCNSRTYNIKLTNS